jgi:hypothetical protein
MGCQLERIRNLRLQLVRLSVAAGGPRLDPQMMDALPGYTLLRTNRNGWIELSTDGERLWVEVERKLGDRVKKAARDPITSCGTHPVEYLTAAGWRVVYQQAGPDHHGWG